MKDKEFKWTDWNCASCGQHKMLKRRKSDGKLICRKCSKNKTLWESSHKKKKELAGVSDE